MVRLADYTRKFSKQVLEIEIRVEFFSTIKIKAVAWYGSKRMAFNVGQLGHRWINEPDQVKVDSLIIHELGHEYSLDHLDHSYYDALSRIGALAKSRGQGLSI